MSISKNICSFNSYNAYSHCCNQKTPPPTPLILDFHTTQTSSTLKEEMPPIQNNDLISDIAFAMGNIWSNNNSNMPSNTQENNEPLPASQYSKRTTDNPSDTPLSTTYDDTSSSDEDSPRSDDPIHVPKLNNHTNDLEKALTPVQTPLAVERCAAFAKLATLPNVNKEICIREKICKPCIIDLESLVYGDLISETPSNMDDSSSLEFDDLSSNSSSDEFSSSSSEEETSSSDDDKIDVNCEYRDLSEPLTMKASERREQLIQQIPAYQLEEVEEMYRTRHHIELLRLENGSKPKTFIFSALALEIHKQNQEELRRRKEENMKCENN